MYKEALFTETAFKRGNMSSKQLFRVERGKDGNNLIKAYNNVPEGYTPREKEFFSFMEAKQCLVSQSGQAYQRAYQQFQYDIRMDEDCCEQREFDDLFMEDIADVAETTTA